MASVRLCSRRGDVHAALLLAASCWWLFTSTQSVLATAVHLPSAGSTSVGEVTARRQLVSSVSVTASQTTPTGVTVVATLAEPGNIWCTVQAASLTAGATPPFELVRSVGTKFTGGVAGANSLSFDPVEGGGGTMIAYCVTKDSATKTESPVGASETFLFGTLALVHAPMCACVHARALPPDSGYGLCVLTDSEGPDLSALSAWQANSTAVNITVQADEPSDVFCVMVPTPTFPPTAAAVIASGESGRTHATHNSTSMLVAIESSGSKMVYCAGRDFVGNVGPVLTSQPLSVGTLLARCDVVGRCMNDWSLRTGRCRRSCLDQRDRNTKRRRNPSLTVHERALHCSMHCCRLQCNCPQSERGCGERLGRRGDASRHV